jgi:riboflavin synthase
MFTGIIEEIGKVRELTTQGMWIDVTFSKELNLGQSVACDGVCLTVVEKDENGFRVDLLEETRRLTAFSGLKSGTLINVERAMKADSRFDGHIVQAHSEGVGTLISVSEEERDSSASSPSENLPLRSEWKKVNTWLLTISVPKSLMRYMILKGIIILNGIALTITKLDDKKEEIEVAIVPHTWENTNLHALHPGDRVNIETDVLAKYIERLMKK